MTSPMGPGFFIFFPPGELVMGPPMQVTLNLVNYKTTALQVTQSVNLALGITQKSEYSLKIIK